MPPSEERPGRLAHRQLGDLDRQVQLDLERLRQETKLAHSDAVEFLIQKMDTGEDRAPDPHELPGLSNELGITDIQEILASHQVETPALAGDLVREVFQGGGRWRDVVRKGMIFLKHRRYREAAEWWCLQRRELGPTDQRLDLLFLLLEMFAARLTGDVGHAERLEALVANHPMRQGVRRLSKPGQDRPL